MVRNSLNAVALCALALIIGCNKSAPPIQNADAEGGEVKDERFPVPATGDIWKDSLYPGFWSNNRIPLLHGVPEDIQQILPEHQRQLIAATDANLAFADSEVKKVSNAYGLDQLREQLNIKNESASEIILKSIYAQNPVRLVGQVEFVSGEKVVQLNFGNSSEWIPSVGVQPYAKDKDGAFYSKPLMRYRVGVDNVSSEVRAVLSTLTDGQWVEMLVEVDPRALQFAIKEIQQLGPVYVVVPWDFDSIHVRPDPVYFRHQGYNYVNFSSLDGAFVVSIKPLQ